jgi:hypothetical protein
MHASNITENTLMSREEKESRIDGLVSIAAIDVTVPDQQCWKSKLIPFLRKYSGNIELVKNTYLISLIEIETLDSKSKVILKEATELAWDMADIGAVLSMVNQFS